jgi:ribosomal-protein-alanine N-acetyltransferase
MHLPPYDTYPNISDGRILLRQIMYSDIPALVDISFYDGMQAGSVEEATAMQERIVEDYTNGNSIHWAIVDIAANNMVGTCGYYRGFQKGAGEIGCILLPDFTGKGFMAGAVHLAIEFGRNTIGLKRIFAITTTQNDKAIKLLERSGFIKTAGLEEERVEYELRGI